MLGILFSSPNLLLLKSKWEHKVKRIFQNEWICQLIQFDCCVANKCLKNIRTQQRNWIQTNIFKKLLKSSFFFLAQIFKSDSIYFIILYFFGDWKISVNLYFLLFAEMCEIKHICRGKREKYQNRNVWNSFMAHTIDDISESEMKDTFCFQMFRLC